MTNDEKVKYWVGVSDEDLRVAWGGRHHLDQKMLGIRYKHIRSSGLKIALTDHRSKRKIIPFVKADTSNASGEKLQRTVY